MSHDRRRMHRWSQLVMGTAFALVFSAIPHIPAIPFTGHAPLHAGPACPASTMTSFEEVAAYIKAHGQLPPNFIQKKDARMLGWNPAHGNLQRVAPCKSIGGDRFSNREKRLPQAPGRIWFEADIDYHGGRRGSKRLIYSSDGLIYKTTDHYQTFQKID